MLAILALTIGFKNNQKIGELEDLVSESQTQLPQEFISSYIPEEVTTEEETIEEEIIIEEVIEEVEELDLYHTILEQAKDVNAQVIKLPNQTLPYATAVENNVVMHAHLRKNTHNLNLSSSTGGYIIFDLEKEITRGRSIFLAIDGKTMGAVSMKKQITTTGDAIPGLYIFDMSDMYVGGYNMDLYSKYYNRGWNLVVWAHAWENFNNIERLIFVPKLD